MARRLSFLLLLALLLGACRAAPTPDAEAGWVYTDLRAVGAGINLDVSPELALVALYVRRTAQEVQIRLDLLDVPAQEAVDLYLAIDSAPGGATRLPLDATTTISWDTLLAIPAHGSIQALGTDYRPRRGAAVRVLRDPVQDTITISLRREALPELQLAYRLEVFSAAPGSRTPAAHLGPASSKGAPPTPGRVLLAFWNTFPAYTPAQALRRWDGAHTGPLGGRHGLYNLLRAARNHRTPVALLDLKAPSSLTALDYAGGLDLVQDMAAQGLLILPDVVPALPAQAADGSLPVLLSQAAAGSRQAAEAYSLPASLFLYSPAGEMNLPGYTLIFTQAAEAQPDSLVSIQRYGRARILPLAAGDAASPEAGAETSAELSLSFRRSLARAAAAAAAAAGSGPGSLLVLGGDLPTSPWGDPQVARAALDYLEEHPWIRVLGASDLSTGTAGAPASPAQPASGQPAGANSLFASLAAAPPNPLGQAAVQALYDLYAPLSPQPAQLAALRAVYLGQSGVLLAAARWAESPAPLASCSTDPDQDGQPECILASDTIFGVYETGDGSLAYAFAISQGRAHQWIGPSSQVALGQGDPAVWDLTRGLSADPQVIPGAFAGGPGPFQPHFQDGNTLALTAGDGSLRKIFRLTPQGLEVEINSGDSPAPYPWQLPLLVDPWQRLAPGWNERYQAAVESQSLSWITTSAGTESAGFGVKIEANQPFSVENFLEPRRHMGQVEDPNADIPPGYYLSFPLALIEGQDLEGLSVQIRLLP